jgi:pyruvate dehydrogenase E2 component (dihydrolipoamide acetyltransferase)
MVEVVVMPKLGLTMETGIVQAWVVAEGEDVKTGEVIAEIATEKITYELESQVDGVLLKIVVPVEGEVPVGTPIAWIGQPGDDWEQGAASDAAGAAGRAAGAAPLAAAEAVEASEAGQTAPAGAAQPGGRVVASPAARKLAEAKGVDIGRIAGTGPGGRITVDDVEAASPSAPTV